MIAEKIFFSFSFILVTCMTRPRYTCGLHGSDAHLIVTIVNTVNGLSPGCC